MNPRHRFRQLGNSFATCLLTVVLFFGGIGFYYFNYYQWGGLLEPLDGLSIVKDVSGPQMNHFRKKAVAEVCDTTELQLTRISKMRRATKGTDKPYTDFGQDCSEIKNRLKEIADDARLKRVPNKFEKPYGEGLLGVSKTYKSLLALEDAVNSQSKTERKRLFKKSLKLSTAAGSKIANCRTYFTGDEWTK